jgi:signal transduction histidine kinase
VREALLRTACEAVNNASRHGRPRRIYVQLKHTDALRMSVLDDGCGFHPAKARTSGGFGLDGMRQRMRTVGGTLTVESEPHVGTCVEASVP